MIVNKEQVPAPLHITESTESIVIPEPVTLLNDADETIVPHAIWEVQHGCQRLDVMLNDTDTVVRLLHFTHTLVRDNLKKPLGRVWDNCKERAPSPTLRVGGHRGLVLEKVHAFTGNDVTSRMGTKHAAMQCNPIVYLTDFDDRVELPETVIV